MPSKSQRAASRQANLRKRRRRGKGAAQTFEVGPAQSTRVSEETEEEPRAAPRPAPASRQAEVAEAAPQYQHLGAELRRIGTATVIILAILAVASVVLGS